MNVSTYLFFKDNCAEAMRFYERVLKGKLDLSKAGDTPGGAPPGASGDLIMHARLVVDGGVIMASDWMSPDLPYNGMSGFSVSLICDTAAEAKPIFEALADGGQVNLPFGDTFFAEGFGMLVDRFGTPWMVGGGMKSMM